MSRFVNIFEFTKFRIFLEEYQEQRSLAESDFSRTEFCNQLGLPNTRSYFNDVLKGKSVSKEMRSRFIKVIGLTGNECAYFEAMIDFDQGKTAEVRDQAMRKMMKLNPNPQIIMDPSSYRLFANWYNVVVFNALATMNIAEDLSELEHRIFPKVTEKKLSEALNLLNKMKLIHKNEDGFWKATRESYATVAKCQDQMVLQYQMKCLELSKLAIESLGKESKDFTTMNFSISKKARKKVESAVETFKKRIREIVREDSEEATNVEHINLHVFSNTKD